MSDQRPGVPERAARTGVRADDTDDDEDADADAADAGSGSSVDVDDDETERTGSVENTTPPAREDEREEEGGDETVPTVELDLYDLSVRVSGQSTDDLSAVESTATSLMDYLVETAQALEDSPDDRGLS
jgi:hypothetical protein